MSKKKECTRCGILDTYPIEFWFHSWFKQVVCKKVVGHASFDTFNATQRDVCLRIGIEYLRPKSGSCKKLLICGRCNHPELVARAQSGFEIRLSRGEEGSSGGHWCRLRNPRCGFLWNELLPRTPNALPSPLLQLHASTAAFPVLPRPGALLRRPGNRIIETGYAICERRIPHWTSNRGNPQKSTRFTII
jgi:hypothetical protein